MKAALFAAVIIIALVSFQMWSSHAAEKAAPPIGTVIDVDGEGLHVVDIPAREGTTATGAEPPPIVLIHGASVNLRDLMIALGDPLSEKHRVILVDRPGRGYSSRPKDGWRLERQAALIHGAVAALGAEKPVIVGQSYGGAVALAYALAYQDEMSGLVLLAPVSHKWPGGVAWYNRVSGWPVAGVLLRRLVIPLYARLAAEPGVKKSFGPNTAPENYYGDSGLALLFRPADFKANAEDLRTLKPQIVDMSTRYGEIRIPTTIMTGASDPTVSPKIHSETLAREIPGAVLDLIPNAGHALHHAETARVVATIEAVAGRN